jgi:hypothetical protein
LVLVGGLIKSRRIDRYGAQVLLDVLSAEGYVPRMVVGGEGQPLEEGLCLWARAPYLVPIDVQAVYALQGAGPLLAERREANGPEGGGYGIRRAVQDELAGGVSVYPVRIEDRHAGAGDAEAAVATEAIPLVIVGVE